MDLILRGASKLKAEVRVGRAISEFEATLSDEKKIAFRSERDAARQNPPGPMDIKRFLAQIDKQPGQPYGRRFKKILEFIQQFLALGDLMVGGSQNIIACGVWSVVRLTLIVATGVSTYREKVSQLFLDMGRTCPRHKELVSLYPQSKRLQSATLEYLIVIIEVCQKLTQVSFLDRLKATLKVSLTDSNLKSVKDDLEKWAQEIDREASLLEKQSAREESRQNSHFRQLISLNSEQEARRRRLEERMKWLDTCSEYDYERHWTKLRKLGNANLYLQNTSYQQWKDNPGSSTLLCTGKLGSGKSVLLANLADNLILENHDQAYSVACFFISDDKSSLSARTIIGCLVRQLLQIIPNFEWTTNLQEEQRRLSSERLIEIARRSLPNSQRIFIIVDGVDECPREERLVLFEQIKKLQALLPLSFCGSIRLEASHEPTADFDVLGVDYILEIPKANPEIAAFIDAQLADLVESQRLIVGNNDLIGEIRECLVNEADGMFLWATLQLEAICREETDEAIREALRDIPTSLPATFDRILSHALTRRGGKYQLPVLKILVAAFTPLTTGELRECLSMVPGDTSWIRDRMINDIYKALACCGSIVCIDEEELTVHVVHQSARQFLLGDMEDSSPYKRWQFSLEDAHRQLAGATITYLSVFEEKGTVSTKVEAQVQVDNAPRIPTPDPQKLVNTALSGSMPRTLGKMASRLSKIRSLPTKIISGIDIAKVVDLSQPPKLDPTIHEDFQFLGYSKNYWLIHSVRISEDDQTLYRLWLKLASQAGIESCLTWSNLSAPPSLYCPVSKIEVPAAFLWAIINSHHALLDAQLRLQTRRLDLLRAAVLKLEDMHPIPPLDNKMAARILSASLLFRCRRLTSVLLSLKPDPTYNNCGCLYTAVWSGHNAATRYILSRINNKKLISSLPYPLLEIATYRGDAGLVYILVKHGAKTNYYSKEPPLLTALRKSPNHPRFIRIACMLLKNGADTRLCDRQSYAPAWIAISSHVNPRAFDINAYIDPTPMDWVIYHTCNFNAKYRATGVGVSVLVFLFTSTNWDTESLSGFMRHLFITVIIGMLSVTVSNFYAIGKMISESPTESTSTKLSVALHIALGGIAAITLFTFLMKSGLELGQLGFSMMLNVAVIATVCLCVALLHVLRSRS